MKKLYLALAPILLICAFGFAQTTVTFNYTGAMQTWVVPPCVTQVTVTVNGGAGGTGGETSNNSQDVGGNGGSVVGVLNVVVGSTLNIYVGGAGQNGTPANGGGVGGWNGGGFGLQGYFPPPPWLWFAGGGGGASDIRVGGTALANRVVVGGGGGGAGFNYFACCNYDQGGPGGGATGQAGWSGNVQGAGGSGFGGSQVAGGVGGTWGGYCTCANGTLGVGSNDCVSSTGNSGGGGGGGYYGGGAGCWSGGGGGSSYTGGLASVTTNSQGVQTGNGIIKITYTGGGPALTLGTSFTNPICGNCNGTATAIPGGGTLPYTYSWTPSAQTTAVATGLCAGTYTITVHDNCGDVATATVTLVSTSITVSANNTGNELCNGNCTGSASSAIVGGAAPYVYAWTPSGGTNSTATNLCAGTYTVSVTDHNGCTGTASVTITQPVLLTAPITVNNILCNGGTGTETCAPAGGTGPYAYVWNPTGKTTAAATGLSAGTYTVTVTDHNGCTASASATITQPAAVTANMGAPTYPSCNGGTGSVTVTPGGGTPNYTYVWTPIGGTNAMGTGLTAGSYTVTVKDANGCTATASATITQPTVVTATMGAPNYPLCNGGAGSVTVTPGGGTPNYTYVWAPSGGTNAMGTGLTAGSYTVTVKDANGCSATASVTITQPALLSVSATFTHASCNLPNGTATATPAGGVGPYAYIWIPSGETNATATGITAGTYTVTVTDNNHCTASTSVTVTQPSAVTASVTATTGVTCNGGNNGTATAAAAGGSAPYNYLWAPGGNTNAFATGLGAGTYTVTVTDANGCTSSAAGTISEPTALVVTVNGPTLVCQGSSGNFTANVSGGTLPYGYAWSSGATTSAATITPSTPGAYTVTITDANGCTATGQINISFGPPLTVTSLGSTSVCSGGSTTICATASGGTGGNTYAWTPVGLSTACISVSPAVTSTYTLTVTDNCGASASTTTTVQVDPFPSIEFSADIYSGCAPLCIQFRNETTVHGGAGQYLWTFGNGDTMQSSSPIYCYPSSGTFNVGLTVTDSSGCSSTLNKSSLITIYTHPGAAFTYSPQAASILAPTVNFTDQSKDQYGIVSWVWHFGDATDSTSTLRNPSHTYRDTGSYCANLIIMNSKGCIDTATNCLVIAPAFNLYIPSAFTPNGDGVNDVFQPVGKYIKTFEMYIFDRWGMQLYHTTDITQGWKGTVAGGTNIAQQDTYIYKIIVTDSQDNQHSYIGNVSIIK